MVSTQSFVLLLCGFTGAAGVGLAAWAVPFTLQLNALDEAGQTHNWPLSASEGCVEKTVPALPCDLTKILGVGCRVRIFGLLSKPKLLSILK